MRTSITSNATMIRCLYDMEIYPLLAMESHADSSVIDITCLSDRSRMFTAGISQRRISVLMRNAPDWPPEEVHSFEIWLSDGSVMEFDAYVESYSVEISTFQPVQVRRTLVLDGPVSYSYVKGEVCARTR